MVGKPTIGGQVFRVFNENEKQVKNASIWVAGSKYQANDAGVIAVPYSNQPGRRSAIISAGGVSFVAVVSASGRNLFIECCDLYRPRIIAVQSKI